MFSLRWLVGLFCLSDNKITDKVLDECLVFIKFWEDRPWDKEQS